MQIHFHKYQGTGNDFIMIDDRHQAFPLHNEALIAKLCNRRFGIGADGLILLQHNESYDFRMIYFNADGKEGSMCGNGGRCTVKFAFHLGVFGDKTTFMAVDGEHEAFIDTQNKVHLKMNDMQNIEENQDHFFLDTGSPHYVAFVENLNDFAVFKEGKKVRYNERFKNEGTNVNFIEKLNPQSIQVRTYERGVEAETFSCGTGVTAAALVTYVKEGMQSPIDIQTLGGNLQISFREKTTHNFQDIFLIGPAEKVFEGTFEVSLSD